MAYDAAFFTHPKDPAQRIYEALRASFVDRLPAPVVARRFGFTAGYVHLLRHRFRKGELNIPFGLGFGRPGRPSKISSEVREKIIALRKTQRLSSGQIAELLEQDGFEVSVRTVERVMNAAGLPKLPRRTQLLIGITKDRTLVPEVADRHKWQRLTGKHCPTDHAGIFLFLPFIEQLGVPEIVKRAGLPSTSWIPALQYVMSLLALKLLGRERLSHIDDYNFDPALGLFAGLNVLPKCTAISTYSFSADSAQIDRLQAGLLRHGHDLRLYREDVVNLDFHTIPHYGEESVLEDNWAGSKGKSLKSALTLMAQDSGSRLVLYTQADIHRSEKAEQVLEFVRFWKRIRRSVVPTLVFDSQFTTYPKLAELDAMGVKFITLRRRGKSLLTEVEEDTGGEWKRIHIPHPKRKFPNPEVRESFVTLRGYPKELRQIVMRGNGREKPAFLITNDLKREVAEVVGIYPERWRVENAIAEAVKFFHLNAMPSPILVKVHLDVVMTVIADTLYYMLAQQLRGFEECNAPRIFRHFIEGKGEVFYDGKEVLVSFPKRAHNPILRAVPWRQFPDKISWLDGARLRFDWR
jgi:hypothetical protein